MHIYIMRKHKYLMSDELNSGCHING